MSSRRRFSKKKIINYSHVTYFIRCYWSHNIKVIEIGQAASSVKIKVNPGSVITVFRILCKLGLRHALTCLRTPKTPKFERNERPNILIIKKLTS